MRADTIAVGQPLPRELLSAELLDADGGRVTLSQAIGGAPALIGFLRHFGCTGCSQQVDALVPHAQALDALGVVMVLIGNGAPHFIAPFTERHKLTGYPLRLLTDPSRRAFELAGLSRSWWRTIGPVALIHELSARARGYFSTEKAGDVSQQGGLMLCDAAGQVVLAAAAEYAAKPVDPAPFVAAAMLLCAQRGPVARVA